MSMLRTPPRKPTVSVSIQYPSSKLGVLTKIKNEISELLNISSVKHLDEVKELKLKFSNKLQVFNDACHGTLQETYSLNLPQDNINKFLEYSSKHKTEAETFIHEVDNWIRLNNESIEILQENDRESYVSKKTNSSHRSKTSSISSSLRLRIAEEKAKILAEEEFHKEKSLIEEEIRKRRMEEQQHRMKEIQLLRDLDIRKSKAVLKNLEKELDELGLVARSHVTPSLPPIPSIDKTRQWVQESPLPESENANNIQEKNYNDEINSSGYLGQILQKQNEISQKLLRAQETAFLPKQIPDIFDGKDITKYKVFISSFRSIIETRCDTNFDRMHFLQQYTAGEPLELVKSCCTDNDSAGYLKALKLLEQEYGNEFLIANAYLKRLYDWPPIKNEDGKAIRELSIFLMSCSNMMSNISSLCQLNSPHEMQKIIFKLPFKLREKWRAKSFHLLKGGNNIFFKDLSEFVSEQSAIVNQPVFGRIVDEKDRIKTDENKRVFVTSTTPTTTKEGRSLNKCLVCRKENHKMADCYFLEQKTAEERDKIIKENGLCFLCLNKGHWKKDCKVKPKCRKCTGNHITVFHRQDMRNTSEWESNPLPEEVENEQPNGAKASCAATKSQRPGQLSRAGRKVISAAIPVKVRVKGQETTVSTYAGLDGFCTDVFMSEELMKRLGVRGRSQDITLTTLEGVDQKHTTQVLNDVEIFDLEENEHTTIPVVYCKSKWPFTKTDVLKPADIESYPHLSNVPFKFLDENIDILIGMKMSDLLRPLQIVDGPPDTPYASLHRLGWALNGNLPADTSKRHCHFIKTKEVDLSKKLEMLCTQDFKESENEKTEMSVSDKRWQLIMEKSLKKTEDNHYELAMPFHKNHIPFTSNRNQAFGRLMSLRSKLIRDTEYCKAYTEFMSGMLEKGYAERVPEAELDKADGNSWYLVHFGVHHKVKRKLRVVFDCSLKYNGLSLNDRLMQGPDLTNNLLGVLLRFRQHHVAIMADIKEMFYQVRVPKHQQDFLRFLWFSDGNVNSDPVDYRVGVHIFGAVSSPSCSNFVLKNLVNAKLSVPFSHEAKSTITNNFYVDDMLKSLESEEAAFMVLNEVKKMTSEGGFELTSISSNSRVILDSTPSEHLASGFASVDISCDDLPFERALGVVWNVEKDSLGIRVNLKETPSTKRGVLSTIFSIYDPFGIVNPVILPGKRLFQEICNLRIDWDTKIPDEFELIWKRWLKSVEDISNYEIPRHWGFNSDIIDVQLHIFSDGSEIAYAAVAYLRLCSRQNTVTSSFVMSKSRLVPINRSTLTTVPRIELNGSRLAVNIQQILKRELQIRINSEYFWSDSLTVLKYIKSETGRFKTFVTNRVSYIRSHSDVHNWRYVPSKQNPADVASRGIHTNKFISQDFWSRGPDFLSKNEDNWPSIDNSGQTDMHPDPEAKDCKKVATVKLGDRNATDLLLESTSSWSRVKLRVSWVLRVASGLRTGKWNGAAITSDELRHAERSIIKYVQKKHFSDAINKIRKRESLGKEDPLTRLIPIIDKNDVLRVGGRIDAANASYEVRHPIVLPKSTHVAELLMRHFHEKAGHLGKDTILSSIRQYYWIIGANTLARLIVRNCVICKKIQGKIKAPLMADLSKEKVISDMPPFNSVGIDSFGPYTVARGRTTEKGSERELRGQVRKWNNSHLEKWLQQHEINWKFNPPTASHFGGVWEREIRTLRKVLNGVLNAQPIRFNDDTLNTLLCEVEAILNSRPLVGVSDDPNDLDPITPNHLLQLRSEITFPPGVFQKDDLYLRKRWKQAQYLADLFWRRWTKEYLPLLQQRQKWFKDVPNYKIGSIVLLTDQILPRNQWSMGRIESVVKDKYGRVRIADIRTSKLKGENKSVVIRRPITKIILLVDGSTGTMHE